MNVRELMETLRRDILRDTADFVEGDDPRLWSDDTLIRYIDEAYRRFARKTSTLRDDMMLTLVVGQQDYLLDGHVFGVISARLLGNGVWDTDTGLYALPLDAPAGTQLIYPDQGDLVRSGHGDLYGQQRADTRYAAFNCNTPGHMTPGRPLAYSTDEEVGPGGAMKLRVHPRPDRDHTGSTIALRVLRTPLVRLTPANAAQTTLEIPEDYHLQVLDYAAYLALRIVDHEAGDPERAAEFLASFDSHVVEAKRDMQEKVFTPMTWGFGRNGFSYVGN